MRHLGTDEEAVGQAALYALGALEAAEAASFEAHLAGCAACAAEVEAFGAAVAALGEATPPADPPPGARARLLASLAEDGGGRGGGATEGEAGVGDATRVGDATPEAGAGFYILRAGEGEWAATEDEGVTYKLLFADRGRGTVTTLVRMRPGSSIRAHRHLGTEQCLVLEGDVRSGPHAMSAGDFNCSLPGSVHEELVTDGGALLLLVSPAAYESLGH
jgi:anti-sigma factor ChrR (cupin superfamily)